MRKGYLIFALAILGITVLVFLGPIPQVKSYHDFSDKRSFLDIPNFFDVVTNLPFALVGLIGLFVSQRLHDKNLRLMLSVLFASFILLTLGSGYYHLNPNNNTLVYDRIPIGIIISCFFAFIVYDRIDSTSGLFLFIVLSIFSVLSVLYWIRTEVEGLGDLRLYVFIQFFPVMAIPLVLWLYKSPFKHGREVAPIFLFFGLAKFTESFDANIYEITNHVISGHSLKHLFMVLAGLFIVKMIRRRTSFGSYA